MLDAITTFGQNINGTFQINNQSLQLNLADLFSLGDRSLTFSFADHADGAYGRTTAFGSVTLIGFDVSSINTISGNFVENFVDTVVHELLHSYGHVNGISALTQQDFPKDGLDEAAKVLANQLMAAIAANNVDLTADRDDCTS